MDLGTVQHSTKTPTLQQLIWLEEISKDSSSFEAMFRLIVARTNLTEAQALELTSDEVSELVGKVCNGITASMAIMNLGKSWDRA